MATNQAFEEDVSDQSTTRNGQKMNMYSINSAPPTENTALSTYFSDEKVEIPDVEKVCRLHFLLFNLKFCLLNINNVIFSGENV